LSEKKVMLLNSINLTGRGFMQVLKSPRVRPDRGTYSILEILDVDTGKRRVLREFEDVIEAPNYTKDGRGILYNSNGYIFRYDLVSGTASKVCSGFVNACNNDHVLSPDGKILAVSHRTVEDGLSRIYTLPLEGGYPVLVTPIAPSFLHGWSPGGETLVYHAERNGYYNIYAIPSGGGVEKQLTEGPWLDDGPEYSPNGKYILFNSTRTGLMQLWRMDVDNGNLAQMTFDESNSWFAHFSPDGDRVVYIAYKKGDVEPDTHPPNRVVQLRLMSSKGGDFEVVAELFGGQGTINVNSWSPDNKTIAFVSYRLK
jgi:Tol biopolymer transport system component